MATPIEPAAPETPVEPNSPNSDPAVPQGDPAETLGDAGKAAIKAEREQRKAAEKSASEAAAKLAEREAEIARLRRSNAAVRDVDLDALRAEIQGEFSGRLAETAIRAEAKGRLADPADALLYIRAADHLDSDEAAISAAIDELLKSKPYLAAAAADAVPHWGQVAGGSHEEAAPEPASPTDRMARAYGSKT